MDYEVGNLMKEIRDLKRRVTQLETSPRVGVYSTQGDFDEMERVLITNSTGVWSDFEERTVEVTLDTGPRALVLVSARPIFSRAFDSWGQVEVGYEVTGATTIPAGDTEDTCRTLAAYTFASLDLGAVGATYTQVSIESDLTPGENTFRVKGRYGELLNGSLNKPVVMCRAITVTPLDPE